LCAGNSFIRITDLFGDRLDSLGSDQANCGAPETRAGHSAANHPALLANVIGDLNYGIEFFATDFIVVAERIVACLHELAYFLPGAGMNRLRGFLCAFVFRDHMTRSPQHCRLHPGAGCRKLLLGRLAQAVDFECSRRGFALRPPLGISAVRKLVPNVGVDD